MHIITLQETIIKPFKAFSDGLDYVHILLLSWDGEKRKGGQEGEEKEYWGPKLK